MEGSVLIKSGWLKKGYKYGGHYRAIMMFLPAPSNRSPLEAYKYKSQRPISDSLGLSNRG